MKNILTETRKTTRLFAAIALFICLLPSGAIAQDGDQEPGFMGKLKADKIAFITNRLQLTPKEAQSFWPVYNEWEQKRLRLEMEKKAIELKISGELKNTPEAELTKTNEQYLALSVKEVDLLKEYNGKLKEVLPTYKILLLYKAEKQFRTQVLKDLKQRTIERARIMR